MKYIDRLLRCQKLKEQTAYLKIVRGMTLKAIAEYLGVSEKAADYYWQEAKFQIHIGSGK